MTYALSVGGDEIATFTTPLSCFAGTGADPNLACTGAQNGSPTRAAVGTCTVSGSNCDCQWQGTLTNVAVSGTYSVSGSQITTTPSGGGGPGSMGYCVSGDTLYIEGPAVDVPGGQITATRQ
jgi:hypothetical protein